MNQHPYFNHNNIPYPMPQQYQPPILRSTDRLLPVANIGKIMKRPIPKEAKVAKEAKELMQKSASEFIAIVTCLKSTASLVSNEGRVSLNNCAVSLKIPCLRL